MIIIQAFGAGILDGNAIRSNRRLAQIANAARGIREAVVFQKDVPLERDSKNVCIRGEGEYLSTLGLFRRAKLVSSRQGEGEKEIRVLAAPQHLWRCMRDARRVFPESEGFTVTKISCGDYPASEFYCQKSVQWWTRDPWAWWLGIGGGFPWFWPWRAELFIRLVPWTVYQKIAG